MEKTRVQKFIALSGMCSRRKAEELIEQGRVKINGEVAVLGDCAIKTDKIEVDDKRITFNLLDKVYIAMNKKKGYVTTKADEFDRKTIFDLLDPKDRKDNLFTVGRLDKDTSGLILLTNDGDFAQKVIHPSSNITKEYLVQLDRQLEDKDKKAIGAGLILDDYKLSKCKIRTITENRLFIDIHEGKKRQVRRVFEMKGYNVTNLTRIKIGGLDLKDLNLKSGEYVFLSKKELVKEIFTSYK